MSEATGRAEMERRLVQRSMEDESFRQRLLEDPKAVVEQELGKRLPEEVRVVIMEETADTVYLVLPSISAVGEGTELSERELETVAGGAPGPTASGDTCSTAACGGFTCLESQDCG